MNNAEHSILRLMDSRIPGMGGAGRLGGALCPGTFVDL